MRTLLIVVFSGVFPFVAAAQVSCGDTIGKGQTVTLTADLGPCDGSFTDTAALIVDGGTLDLGGHTVTCADGDLDGAVPQGLVLVGKKSKVMNGTVVGCTNGVSLAGDGKHRLESVTAQASVQDGIDLLETAGKCKLLDVQALDSGDDGFEIDSDKNKLTDAVATNNGEDGIDVTGTGDKNKLTNCRGDGNGDDGIEVGGQKNKVKDGTANDNTEDGVDLTGIKNKVTGGSAQGNGGFDLADCAGNKVKGFFYTTATPDCQ
jgi:hypothetical protein